MLVMDICKRTVNGLANFPIDDTFPSTLASIISQVCGGRTGGTITYRTTEDEDTKKGNNRWNNELTDVACLLVEAARHDLDKESLKTFLNRARIHEQTAIKLCDAYITNKTDIQNQLELIGNNSLHIVDVDWRLDYCLKLNTCDSLAVPLYHVRLSTNGHEGTKQHLTFTCTVQRLQELVANLKDALRHLEKLTNL